MTIEVPTGRLTAEVEEKRSRFIAELVPLDSENALRDEQQRLKALHPKASHVCYGFRLISTNGKIQEGFSDDGEPSGTSGPPILRVLQHNNLANCAVLITRYFGGTKLGTGGLQRAYSQSAATVIKDAIEAGTQTWKKKTELSIHCSFAHEADLRRMIREADGEISEETYLPEGPELIISATDEGHHTITSSPLARWLTIRPSATEADN